MNEVHLQQIFTNYINKFEAFNSDDPKQPSEYYKWEMPNKFRKHMDRALNAPDKDAFNSHIAEIKKITRDFVDSGKTLPLAGLAKIAEEYGEWKAVQRLFQGLYEEDNGELEIRQKKIETFLGQAYQLKGKYNLSDLYKSDFRSATVYLFLYDPDHNYIYKPTHAQDFQDCIEFYDDFGTGDHVRLKTYYRMCDQVVEAIQRDAAIQATNELRASKFKDQENVYEDKAWHILAYDIIYCCSSYNLFEGITFERLTPTERRLRWERQEKAKEYWDQLKQAQDEKKTLDAAMKQVEEWFGTGKEVTYKEFGKKAQIENGVILKNVDDVITVDFGNGDVRKMGTVAIVNGYMQLNELEPEGYANAIEMLKNKSSIEIRLSKAEKDFAPYSAYL